jgi:hypothetical protein
LCEGNKKAKPDKGLALSISDCRIERHPFSRMLIIEEIIWIALWREPSVPF